MTSMCHLMIVDSSKMNARSIYRIEYDAHYLSSYRSHTSKIFQLFTNIAASSFYQHTRRKRREEIVYPCSSVFIH